MGKATGGAFGAVRGRVGDAIGSNWKGIKTVRSMPLSVANPQSVAQTAQRTKFAQCVAVARLLLSDLINVYWLLQAKKMSAYNAFIKQNIDAFDSDGLATPANFSAARGILTGVSGLDIGDAEAGGSVSVDFDDNSGVGDALGTDLLNILLYNETQDKWQFKASNITRADTHDNISPDPATEVDDVLHFYVFFARADGSKISDSSYDTRTVIAP